MDPSPRAALFNVRLLSDRTALKDLHPRISLRLLPISPRLRALYPTCLERPQTTCPSRALSRRLVCLVCVVLRPWQTSSLKMISTGLWAVPPRASRARTTAIYLASLVLAAASLDRTEADIKRQQQTGPAARATWQATSPDVRVRPMCRQIPSSPPFVV